MSIINKGTGAGGITPFSLKNGTLKNSKIFIYIIICLCK